MTLVMIFSGAMVYSINYNNNTKSKIDEKISEYVILNRYVRSYSSLEGVPGRIYIDSSNKINVSIGNNNNKSSLLNNQIEELNNGEDVIFESDDTNVVTYMPDGSVDQGGIVSIKIDTNVVSVSINEWNQVKIIIKE